MFIFLYGQDTFRSQQKLNEIVAYYQKIHKSGLNLKYFEGKMLSFEDFQEELQTISMFQEKKLMILKNVFSNQEFKEKFLKNFEKFKNSKEIILFYETEEISEKDPFFHILIRQARVQEFKPLEGQRLKNWVKKEFRSYKMEIDDKAIETIINFVGNDLWQMANEIKKLVSFKKEGGRVSQKDIELLVKPKLESDIFKTIDAIASKNKKIALRLIKEHLEKGDSPLYLLSMVAFQFRNLLMVKDLIEKNLSPYCLKQLHPYIIKKCLFLSRKFDLLELKKIYQKIFQVDLNIKTGKIEPEIALDLLISEI